MPEQTHTNRLIHQTSPYLLQHAHNPVDWYPWGPEAFAAARAQNKPIFLSIGYSTCYWCHVMERQCFENEDIARQMNQSFINIKVDREERPDVDQLYMAAVQVLTHSGGWPMSVFLTPDLKPFYGGTYIPPKDAFGRPGFLTLLQALDQAYHTRPDQVTETTTQMMEILQQLARPAKSQTVQTIDTAFIDTLVGRSIADYEPAFGGFGQAPKFPRQTLLQLLLAYSQNQPDGQSASTQLISMITHTLDCMAAGGIRDHLGGGFHRYSTDDRWLVPHFEIMLYDNAMLAWVYAEAHRLTGGRGYDSVARNICDFLLADMTSPQGAFYTALDAEVDTHEGGSYLWTADQIHQVLGKNDAAIFNTVYGLDLGANFADPHHGTGSPDTNVLYLPQPLAEVGKKLNMEATELETKLTDMRTRLLAARRRRKQPMRDEKILTSWNALAIRGLAHAGQVIGESRYVQAASRAADYLLLRHLDPDGGLYRTSRDGKVSLAGFLDDYAFLVQALLTLAKVTGEKRWRQQAEQLADQMERRFADNQGGYFFADSRADDLIVRQKTAADSPLPSGNAVAAITLLELGRDDQAKRILTAFADQLDSQGEGMSAMVEAALHFVRQYGPIQIAPNQLPVNQSAG